MTDEHEELREWSAAYVLGALEPAERTRYQRHLDTCPTCQDDVRTFAALPGLLATVDRDAIDDEHDAAAARVTRRAVERAAAERAVLLRSRRRWRGATVAAVAVAVLLGVLALPRGATLPEGVPLAVTDATGSVLVAERGWGTHVELELADLPERDRYLLLVVADDGTVQTAATWGATPGGRARLSGATSIPVAQVDRVLVTSEDPADVLVTAAPTDGGPTD